ncbi:MAG: hypothetical protein J6I53_12550 [Treponema sp.]|nr:hypothetical protein [Treponema sp.]
MKKATLSALLCAFASNLFAISFFSGETGIAATSVNKKVHSFDPSLEFKGFFAGHFAITNSLSVRTELALKTSDLYEEGITNEADSVFKIKEFSAHYIKSFAGATHTFTAFRGDYEPIGSQQFIKRQLGVEGYASAITENFLGANGANAYTPHGIGGSYALSLKTLPVSTGISVSKNKDVDGEPELNADWRLAIAFRNLKADFLLGAGAPIYTEKDGEDVFLLIDTLYIHSGLDMLIGNRYSPLSLYTLGGFSYMPIKKQSDKDDNLPDSIKPENIFLIVEPRLSIDKVKIYLSVYNIPSDNLADLLFIEENLGACLRIFSDSLYTANREFTFGLSGNIGLEGKFFDDLKSFKTEEFKDALKVKAGPFAEIEANKGLLKLALEVNATKIIDEEEEAFKLHVGYKKEL